MRKQGHSVNEQPTWPLGSPNRASANRTILEPLHAPRVASRSEVVPGRVCRPPLHSLRRPAAVRLRKTSIADGPLQLECEGLGFT